MHINARLCHGLYILPCVLYTSCTTINSTHAFLYQQSPVVISDPPAVPATTPATTDPASKRPPYVISPSSADLEAQAFQFPNPRDTLTRLQDDLLDATKVDLQDPQQKTDNLLSAAFGSDEKEKFFTNINYGQNVIWVPDGCTFTLHLDQLNPGWIHQQFTVNSNLTDSTNSIHGISSIDSAYLRGRQLWVLVKMTQVVGGDPLGLQSKTVNACSSIDYDEMSDGLLPLDADDINGLKMEANNLWDIEMAVYEVADIRLKQVIANAAQNPPAGLTDILKTVSTATAGYATTLLGTDAQAWGKSLLQTFINTEEGSNLVIEQILLKAGARLEFEANFSIKRFSVAQTNPVYPSYSQRYMFVDLIKSRLVDPVYSANQADYQTAQNRVAGIKFAFDKNTEELSFSPNSPSRNVSSKEVPFLIMTVSVQPTPQTASTSTTSPSDVATQPAKQAPEQSEAPVQNSGSNSSKLPNLPQNLKSLQIDEYLQSKKLR